MNLNYQNDIRAYTLYVGDELFGTYKTLRDAKVEFENLMCDYMDMQITLYAPDGSCKLCWEPEH